MAIDDMFVRVVPDEVVESAIFAVKTLVKAFEEESDDALHFTGFLPSELVGKEAQHARNETVSQSCHHGGIESGITIHTLSQAHECSIQSWSSFDVRFAAYLRLQRHCACS